VLILQYQIPLLWKIGNHFLAFVRIRDYVSLFILVYLQALELILSKLFSFYESSGPLYKIILIDFL
jgi:hypothetical protein